MKLRPITKAITNFSVKCEPDELPPEGNCMASGDLEYDAKCAADIRKDLAAGNRWAWCYIVVTAKHGHWSGRAGLGACSYASEADFLACDYYEGLCNDALANMNAQMQEASKALEPFIID